MNTPNPAFVAELKGYRVFCSNFGLLVRHQSCGQDLGIVPSGSDYADLFTLGRLHRHECRAAKSP